MNIAPFFKIANRVLRKCQSLIGMSTLGARAIVLDDENKILLVKHTYQPHWYVPGGGIKKRESPKTALLRELREEVGIAVLDEPILFGIYHHHYLEVDDYPIIYIVKNFSEVEKPHSPEIAEIRWFAYDQLPEMISPGTKRRLDEYFTKQIQSDIW